MALIILLVRERERPGRGGQRDLHLGQAHLVAGQWQNEKKEMVLSLDVVIGDKESIPMLQ